MKNRERKPDPATGELVPSYGAQLGAAAGLAVEASQVAVIAAVQVAADPNASPATRLRAAGLIADWCGLGRGGARELAARPLPPAELEAEIDRIRGLLVDRTQIERKAEPEG